MNGILVAVCGNNGIGKTTFAAALAAATTRKARKVPFNILLVSGDTNVPALGCWAPSQNSASDFGALMAEPNLEPETVARNVSFVSGLETIGLLGYPKSSKSRDYEPPEEDKVARLLMGLKRYRTIDASTGAVIVDCGDPQSDPFSAVALREADVVFMLLHGDRQGVLYYHSNERYFKQFEADEIIYSIVPVSRNTFDPVDSIVSNVFHTDFPALPRIDEAHRKMVEGKLFAPYENHIFREVLNRAADEVLEAAQYGD